MQKVTLLNSVFDIVQPLGSIPCSNIQHDKFSSLEFLVVERIQNGHIHNRTFHVQNGNSEC